MISQRSKYESQFTGEAVRWKRRFGRSSKNQTTFHGRLYATIDEFEKFTIDYYAYFKNENPDDTGPTPWLDERIKNTLLEYWMPLSNIAAQYYLPEYKDRLKSVTEKKLPKLTANTQRLDIGMGDVLLYINKLPDSYFYPYTTRSFIALSWTDQKEGPDDIMALPHEIGHHIYWNNNFGNPGDIFTSRLTLPESFEEKSIEYYIEELLYQDTVYVIPTLCNKCKTPIELNKVRWEDECTLICQECQTRIKLRIVEK